MICIHFACMAVYQTFFSYLMPDRISQYIFLFISNYQRGLYVNQK